MMRECSQDISYIDGRSLGEFHMLWIFQYRCDEWDPRGFRRGEGTGR